MDISLRGGHHENSLHGASFELRVSDLNGLSVLPETGNSWRTRIGMGISIILYLGSATIVDTKGS